MKCKHCDKEFEEKDLWGISRNGDLRTQTKTYMCGICKKTTTSEMEKY